MVATLAPVASTDAAELYYLDNQASVRPKADYYAVGKEPDGVWLNPAGLFDLPDRERVTTADFHSLFWGFSPTDGAKLSRNAGSASRSAAIDITFSADKSISALWAIADPELRTEIERAHNDAARESYERWVLGECAHTRRTDRNGALGVVPADLIAAMFQHGENREQEPHLHTHVVCFNVARARDDGKYRTHHQHPAFVWTKTMGAWYRAGLAWHLQDRLGIRMEQYGANNEFTRIAAMPEELIQSWSSRTGQIHAWARTHGVNISNNPGLAQAATLNTRKHKKNLGGRDAQFEGWLAQAEQMVPDLSSLLTQVLGQDIHIGPEDIRSLVEHLRTVPEDLMRAEAVVRLPAIAAEAANRSATKLKPAAIDTAVARVLHDPTVVELEPKPTIDAAANLRHTEIFTTKHTLLLEETVTKLAQGMLRSTGHGIDSAAVDTKIAELKSDGYPVSDEQIAAIRAVATSEGRIAVIEGAAGSGKTTTLRPLADLWREAGRKITATAVPWRTATALGTDVDAPMYSVAKLLNMAARDQLALDDRSIVIVDEAGMLSTREIHHLMQLSERTGAKFLFCGDTRQQQPVEAGPGLRLVRDVVGSSRIAMIRRQKADIEDVLRHQRNLSPDDARAEAETMSAAEHNEIVAEFEASPQAADRPFTPWQIAASEDFRDGNTRGAIAAYRDRGRFHLCRNIDATIEKLADDVARYTDENPGKTVAVMARTNAERRALSLALRRHALGDAPRNAHVVAVSDRQDGRHHAPLEIAVGDRLRIGATHWQKQLFNGSIVIVDDLQLTRDSTPEDPRVRIHGHTEDGRSVSFDHDEIRDYHGNVRLDHGYALTITSAQGLTVDAAFLLADSQSARQTIYPAATRHRESLNIYVDRQAAALEVGLRRVDHDKVEQIVTDDQIVEHLEKSWTRSSPKQAAHDYRVRQARAPRPEDASPTPDTPASAPQIDRLVRDDRQHALELVHGNTIAALASGRRRVLQSYAEFRARAAAGENIADEPAFLDTLDRHAALVTAAEPFRTHQRKFANLLKRRGGLTNDDLEDFRHHLKRARDYRRGRVLSKTIAARGPHPARRRGSTPPRVDRHRPLPDHVADAIERDIEALVPAGPAVGAHLTPISPAADVAPDAGDALADPMPLDPARHAPTPAPTPDAGEEDWSDEDLEHYAQSIAAAAGAPDTDADLPEDPGWAEYAASLDAPADPPVDPATDFPAPGPEDDAGAAPYAPPREPPAPTPAPPPVQPTAAELYELFITRFRDHRRRFENTHLSPWHPKLFRSHMLRAREALQHPDLSGSQRAAIQEILDAHTHYLDAGDRLTALAEDLKGVAARFKSMCDETHRTGARLIDHPDYSDWYENAVRIRKNDVRSLPGYASWLKENPHVWKAIDSDYDQFRLNNRLATRIVEVRAQYDDFHRRRQAIARKARHDRTEPWDSPDLPGLRRTALALKEKPHLPDPQRALLQDFVARDLAQTATRDLAVHRAGLESIADESLRSLIPLDRHPRYAQWREHGLEIDSSVDKALTACSQILTGGDRIEARLAVDRAGLHERHDLAIRATRRAHELARFAPDLRTRELPLRIAHDLAHHLQGLPAREHPAIDGRLLHYAETPQYIRWAETAKGLLERAKRATPAEFLEQAGPTPEVLAAIHRRQRQLEDILDRNTYASREDDLLDDLRLRTDAVQRSALRDGAFWIDHPSTPELTRRADLLGQRPHATSEMHDFRNALGRDYQAAVEMRERRIRLIRLDADLSDHLNDHKAISREAERLGIHPGEHPQYQQWSRDVDRLKAAVDELFDERGAYRGPRSPGHDYARDTRIGHNATLLVHIRNRDISELAELSPQRHPAQEPTPEIAPPDHVATPEQDPLNAIEAALRQHLDAYEPIRQQSRREGVQIHEHPGYDPWSRRAHTLMADAVHILEHPDADHHLHPEHNPERATRMAGYAGRLRGILKGNVDALRIVSPQPTPAPTPEPEEQPKPDISPDPDRGPGIGF